MVAGKISLKLILLLFLLLTLGVAAIVFIIPTLDFFKTKPNVILIVIDTCRVDRLGCYGYSRKTTPRIDALAKNSLIFSSAYATDSWTLPSHASLFTGLYPSQADATSETGQLPSFNTTISEVLKSSHYYTSAFVCNSWISIERGFNQGFDEFHEMWRESNLINIPPQPGRSDKATTKRVIDWLETHKKNQNPFYLFLNFNCVHMPYQPPEPYLSTFLDTRNGYNKEEIKRLQTISGLWGYLAGQFKLSKRDLDIMNDLYDGEVAFADYCIGQILNTLKDLDLFENTIVIITSDHGENLGEHGLIDHLLSMHETTLHIPLLIHYPKKLPRGKQNNELVSLVDIAPTILKLCGIKADQEIWKPSGSSLIGKNSKHRAFIVAENERPINGLNIMKNKFPSFDTSKIDFPMRALRTKGFKLIWEVGIRKILFILESDLKETFNVIDKFPEVSKNLHKILLIWMSKITSIQDTSFLESQDEESLNILRSLGYIE